MFGAKLILLALLQSTVFAAVPWDRPSRQSPFPVIRPNSVSDDSSSWIPPAVKEGLSCFSCEGKDTGRCLRYFEADDIATCRSNEYCAVTRTELKGSIRVWRGCLSASAIKTSLQENARHNELNAEGNKKFTQFCQTNQCNSGNGLLKCHKCEGSGEDDKCMKKISSDSMLEDCGPNQYCSTVRTTLSTVDVKTNETLTSYHISRKCENHQYTRWNNSIEYPYSLNLNTGRYEVAYSCFTDKCNGVMEGQELSNFKNASEVSRSSWTVAALRGYFTFLADPRSTSISWDGSRIYFKDIRKHLSSGQA